MQESCFLLNIRTRGSGARVYVGVCVGVRGSEGCDSAPNLSLSTCTLKSSVFVSLYIRGQIVFLDPVSTLILNQPTGMRVCTASPSPPFISSFPIYFPFLNYYTKVL